jgi:hypothetical protein
MRTLLFTIALFCCTFANAQWVWIGGTPGKATDWMEPRNWNLNQVPDEDASIRIPQLNQSFYPKITETVPPIAHLEIEGGAALHIAPNGFLQIDGQHTYNTGIMLTGKIFAHGLITVINTAQGKIAGNQGHLITYQDGRQVSFIPAH